MNDWHSDDIPPATEVEIMQVTIKQQRVVVEEVDRRYRIMVLLQRSDRPKYWTMHCFHCQTPLMELVNAEIEAISDVVSFEDTGNVGVGIRCRGPFCKYWYYVKLNGVTLHLNGKQ